MNSLRFIPSSPCDRSVTRRVNILRSLVYVAKDVLFLWTPDHAFQLPRIQAVLGYPRAGISSRRKNWLSRSINLRDRRYRVFYYIFLSPLSKVFDPFCTIIMLAEALA